MSKHWNPRIARGGRRVGGLPPAWNRYRYRRKPLRVTWSEVRLSVLAGLLGGLIYAYQVGSPLVDLSGERAGAGILVPAGAADVIDGDTFRYGGQRIRIADIDTPEVKGRCAYETELAARATRRMKELLAVGPFTLEPISRDEDRYGRKLRIVTRNGRSLGDQLVAEGLARTWSGRGASLGAKG